MAVVSIQNLDVVFGDNKQKTLSLMDKGYSREKVLSETGDVIGVQGASIDVEEGEICVLMGLSGSGKSTLLRTVNGLNKVARGRCLVRDGEKMVDMATCDANTLRHMRTHRVSMVFQSFALMPWLSVLDNVAFGLEMQGMGKAERTKKAMEQLAMVGLSDWAHKTPDALSGGMRQRVGLARAFAMDTDVLLMDEPFSALDPLIRSQLQDELIDLQKKLKKTIIFVSHDLDEALKIGSKIAIMESARIIQQDIPEQIVLNPATEYVEKFVAHTNPLNVLKGDALMTPLNALGKKEGRFELAPSIWMSVSESGEVQSVVNHETQFTLVEWKEGTPISLLPQGAIARVPVSIGMRDAVEICYQTGEMMLLEKGNECVGVLADQNFYHALLGKHFSSAQNA